MKTREEQIEQMAKVIQGILYYAPDEEDDRYRYLTHLDKESAKEISEKLYAAGYRKASEVIGEFVEKINLVECEMFHKAHDIRNASEEKLDRCNWKDDLQWGEYKKQEGKMIALQDFMTKIERIAAQYGVEVEEWNTKD